MDESDVLTDVLENTDKRVLRLVISREIERLERLRSVFGILSPEEVDKIIEEIESGGVP